MHACMCACACASACVYVALCVFDATAGWAAGVRCVCVQGVTCECQGVSHQSDDVQCDAQCCLVDVDGGCWAQHLDAGHQLVDAAQHKGVLLLDVLCVFVCAGQQGRDE